MIEHFLLGAMTLASLAIGLFFLKFHRDTRDRLFLAFGLAFAILAINWAVLSVVPLTHERQPYVYLIRLAAFSLIIWAILDKNRGGKAPRPPSSSGARPETSSVR